MGFGFQLADQMGCEAGSMVGATCTAGFCSTDQQQGKGGGAVHIVWSGVRDA
jgi:hypothetical protein